MLSSNIDTWEDYCKLRKEVKVWLGRREKSKLKLKLVYAAVYCVKRSIYVGMVDLLHQLFKVVWREETLPKQRREGLIVNLFNKRDKEDPGNYKDITLLSVVGKVFCKVVK